MTERRNRFGLGGILLAISLTLLTSSAQAGGEGDGILRDTILIDGIGAVHLGPSNWELGPPIMLIGGQGLVLSFEVIDRPTSHFEYRIQHCTRNWTPSNLSPLDYQTGFEFNPLPMATFSTGTTVPFSRYEVQLPNRDVALRLSGNYVVQVVDPAEGQAVVLQRRFMVCEPLVKLRPQFREVTGPRRLSHQAVECWVDLTRLGSMANPSDVQVECRQNWHGGQSQTLRPTRFQGAQNVLFGGFGQGEFPGHNEWHTLDLQTLHTPGEGVHQVDYVEGEYHVEAEPIGAGPRPSHWARPDLNGYSAQGYNGDWRSKLPTPRGGRYTPLTSDYAWVYFSLRIPLQPAGSRIFLVVGGKTGEKGETMRFSPNREQYEARLRLKQGVYSYRFGISGLHDPLLDQCQVEGSFRETENEYNVLVYYRRPGQRYDELVGWARFSNQTDGKSH